MRNCRKRPGSSGKRPDPPFRIIPYKEERFNPKRQENQKPGLGKNSRSPAQTVKKTLRGSCQRGRSPSDYIHIDRLTCGRQIPLQGFAVRSTRSGGEFSALLKTLPKRVRSTEDEDSPERATAVRSLRRVAGQAATVSGEKDRRRRAFLTN